MQTLPLITSKFTPILCGCGGHQWHWFGSFLVPCREAGPSSRRKLFTFFAFLAKTRPIPQFWYSSSIPASQTKYLLCGPLINFILKAAMSALLPCPSTSSAGDRPRRLPLSTLSSPPPLPPQLPPPSAHHHYHRHCCRRCSVSAATARCCHCCCRRRRHHRRRRFCF